MSHLKLAIIAVALSATLAPASVAEKPTTRSVEIDLRGLDLSSSADMTLADRRIRNAAKHVCTDTAGAMTLKQRRNFRNCYEAALEDAYEQLGPVSAEMFAQKEDLQG